MKGQRFFTVLALLFLLLLTTTNQPISSSPDSFIELENLRPSQSELELAEMQDIFREYEQWLTGEVTSSGTVGAAVAILYKDQVAFMKCFGTQKIGSSDSIDEHTIFRLASVSKPVTGVLAGLLAQEEIIDFDEKVAASIPGFCLSLPASTRQLSIRHLLSHTTGLVPHAYDDLVEGYVPLSNIVERLKYVDISAPPGELYGYQNVMFSLLDTILSVKTSKSYSELIKEKLFGPLGMNDASADFESFRDNPNKAFPHSGGNGRYRALPLNDRYYSTAPAAGVNASISDLSQFLLALLDEENPLLQSHIMETVFTPQVNSHLHRGYFRYWNKAKSKRYAIGWRTVDYKGRHVAYHGGYVNGYKAEIALCSQEHIGIVYLSNSPNSVASQSIPVFLDAYFHFKDNEPVLAQSENVKEDDLKSQGS
ncbi:class A beta-lactamase-related serine hydrolase [Mariniphaga sediminis]|uniref:Class A beta-lactamase-related serine hydrolase n=1 Tax=Mariniphaga sediminis TaxID=1628158 RepID=A0A399D7Y2_9BACT|nr:serine hydrolase domain-containing protein [Mariniphaga sediminis]RIH66632.1 class A beta-lactamase-related serine hydrolase [Mariniphaga sediminis]